MTIVGIRHLAEIRFTDLPARLPTLALASKSTIETRKPPLWDDGDAQVDDGVQIEPTDWDLAAQPAPDFEVDQRINWCPGKTVTQTRWRVAMRPAYPAHR